MLTCNLCHNIHPLRRYEMYISKLLIRNFRNFKNAKFLFNKGINTLIGENGSGKTNVFQSIRLLIDDSLPINATNLDETDFNRNLKSWKGHWIIISISFDELDSSDVVQCLSVHSIGHVETPQKGTYSLYFRPKKIVRKQLYELTQDKSKSKEKLNELLSKLTLNDYESIYKCKALADFSKDDIYTKYVGDFENIEFPNPDKDPDDQLGCFPPKIFSIQKELSCTFIKALRDVIYDLKNTRYNPLLILLKEQAKDINNIKSANITDKIKNLNKDISELDEIKTVSKGIKSTLKSTAGTTFAPNIDIKSELPDDMEKLLHSLTLWVGDYNDGDYQGQIKELSLGGANLIYLSMKILEYEFKKSTDKIANFLLIEEPEAHIHTHLQKTLFERCGYNRTQIIISTHSTHISAASKICSVNILSKCLQESKVFQPSVGLTSEQCSRIERYLDAVRSTLLFARGVILVEGDAELILIPEMFKAVFGLSLDEIGISIVNMSSTVFTNIALIFSDERIHKRCSIVTDKDTSIVKLPAKKDDDDDYQRKCRNSENSGITRKTILDDFCKDNRWIETFYADHTFEVDFIMNDNSWEVKKCLTSIYSSKSKSDINDSSRLLESKDVAIAGKEVLRLSNKMGKGWFSLLISENLVYNTHIPHYILKAIAFTCEHLTDSNFESMILHRTIQGKDNENDSNKDEFLDFFNKIQEMPQNGYTISNLIEEYISRLPKDQLSYLINYYRGYQK